VNLLFFAENSVFLLEKLMSRKLALGLFLVLFVLTSVARSEYPDFELLRADGEGVVFQYNVPPFSTFKLKTERKTYDMIRIPHCIEPQISGIPQLPQRIVLLGIPPGCEIKTEVLDYEYKEFPDLSVAPVPEIHYDSDEMSVPVFSEDNFVYAKSEFYPDDIVSVEKPFWIRDQRVVRIKINPVQFHPQNNGIKFYEIITMAIDFSGEKTFGEKPIKKEAFEKVYKNILLNYQKARNFRQKRKKPPLFKSFGESPFSFSDIWYKIEVEDLGIYKIERTDLENAGINVDEINPKNLRIFNGGGRELPLDNFKPRPELKELAIEVFGEEDEKFDGGDYILFYGWGTSGWEYDTSKGEYQHHINHYTDKNVFWLTFSGSFPDSARRIEEKDGSLVNPDFFVPIAFKDYVFVEKEKELHSSGGHIHDYFNWYESKNNVFSPSVTLTNVEIGENATIKVKTYSNYAEHIKVNGTEASLFDSTDHITYARSKRLMEGENRIDFEFRGPVYFDWYEISYMKKFQAEYNKLLFGSPDTTGVIQYEISSLSSASVLLFDITDKFAPKKLIGFQLQSDTLIFQDGVEGQSKKRYYLLSENDLSHPKSIVLDVKSDLRKVSNRADILVITHPDFLHLLSQYELLREKEGIEVKIVDVFDIYDEFSWGLFDPVGIRDLLKYTFDYWESPKPSFVLLVGDGNYDYKNNLGDSPESKIPPFVGYYPISDDNFVYFGKPGSFDSDSEGEVDMIIGRVPAKSGFEVQAFTEKIREYEKEPVYGRWRNIVTLVADDTSEGCSGDADPLWRYHTRDTETLARSHVPYFFNLNKIYLLDFPFDVNGEKPEATDAIVDAFNRGTVLLNWIGHGNTQQWAHEKVFKRTEDIPRLENQGMYPLVFSATCSNAIFFDPLKESMAEDLVRAESKGAIAMISSTGLVLPFPNAELNFAFYDHLLESQMRIGEALFTAKLSRESNYNDRYYVLLGDPYTILATPKLKVEIKDLTPDTLSALKLTNFKGEVKDPQGNVNKDFSGFAYVLAFDSEKKKSHLMPNDHVFSYELSGQVIFRGGVEVDSGEFEVSFFVPKDISYGGNTARLSVYVKGPSIDGTGALDSLVVWGSDTSFFDTLGPEIKLGFTGYPDFQNGDFVESGATMILEIFDSSGINLTGEVGHGISMIFDDDWANQVELSDSFEYDVDDYQGGSISYRLSRLSTGKHFLKIKAWDNFNNSSLRRIDFGILSSSDLRVEVLNYPNPFSDNTNFWYRVSGKIDRVEIKIYTLGGKLIRTISSSFLSQDYLIWDGKDQEGDLVANGVYIYKIAAFVEAEGGKKAEAFGKVVVMH